MLGPISCHFQALKTLGREQRQWQSHPPRRGSICPGTDSEAENYEFLGCHTSSKPSPSRSLRDQIKDKDGRWLVICTGPSQQPPASSTNGWDCDGEVLHPPPMGLWPTESCEAWRSELIP